MKENLVSLSSSNHQQSVSSSNEQLPLLQKARSNKLLQRYCDTRKCISSKAALLILVSSFPVTMLFMFVLQQPTYIDIPRLSNSMYFEIASSGFAAIIYCFYPLAGHLADIKIGRYKTVLTSLWMVFLGLALASVVAGFVFVGLVFKETDGSISTVMIYIGAIITFAVLILVIVGLIGFNANVIQFGLDQLHDSPAEDQSLFIHWYTWTIYVALLTVKSIFSTSVTQNHLNSTLLISLVGSTYIIAIVLFMAALCLAHRKQRWFLIEPTRLNPYNLVYKVSKFAHQHKVPVHRSAFTYCEDELPSGLDLGKDKYGGPFTTEQVEDVKIFYGILKILFCLGPVFFLNVASDPALSLYISHVSNYTYSDGDQNSNTTNYNLLQIMENIFLLGETLYPLLVVVCIPFYLFFFRPFVSYYIPGMLRRIGVGIIVIIISLIHTFFIETMTHVEDRQLGCMFTNIDYYNESYSNFNMASTKIRYFKNYLLLLQSIMLALSKMLIYVAIFELVCSQSPHSMKGLLIGLFFAIKGVFKLFGSAIVIPFALGWYANSFPSCGMYYYLINIGVSLMSLVVYTCVARRYKYRVRDEPCHVHRYVEDYYSKLQQQRLNRSLQ